VNWPEPEATQVWEEVLAFRKIPIEMHFKHVFHNSANECYPCVAQTNVRRARPQLSSLFGLLQRCWAFIGVASGPWCAAMAIMPERCLFLERNHRSASYTNEPVAKLRLDTFEEGQVTEWLNTLS
jgi:hypothetical protein